MDNSISRQDAIDVLKRNYPSSCFEDLCKAVDMAIKALEQPESCKDMVPRTSVEYICEKNTVSTNPYEHKYHDKFIQFMDDPEISDFGRWQHSNGFNTALVAVKCDLDKLPSAQPEQSEPKDVTFWKKRAREYEEMIVELTAEMARGIEIDSILLTEEGIVFTKKNPEQR